MYFQTAGEEKGGKHGQYKDQDIHCQGVFSGYAGAGIKGGYDEKHAQNHTKGSGAQETGRGFGEDKNFKKGIDKGREKEHFQMLPYRFIDGKK